MKTISISQWVAERGTSRPAARPSATNTLGSAYAFGACGRAAGRDVPRSVTATLSSTLLFLLGGLVASAQVNLPIGNLLPGEKVTITFDVTITNPFPASATAVTNQGTVSGSNFLAVNTDDPQTIPFSDATVTPVFVPPLITSTNNATFTVGISGVFNVTRTGIPTPDLFVSGTLPNGVGFNPGTGNLAGTPTAGTGGVYPLVITATNVAGTNVQNFTLTVRQSPAFSCASNTTTNTAPGLCSQTVAFSATITGGYPPPTATYKLGTNVITSPYAFPKGTNVVQVTITNGVPPDKSCSFTVTVLPVAEAPLLSIALSGTNAVLCWSNIFGCYALQYTPELLAPPSSNVWTAHPGPFVPSGGNIYVTNAIGATNRFFRLAQ